ncbi:hypothetical protein ACN47E_001233 [Coniothyrium glycines]
MLGYISSTRKKSCYGCVKAKRRCDLGYPFCKRCFVKGLDCKYPNAARTTVRDPNVIIRQSTPDLAGLSPSTVARADAAPIAAIAASVGANVDPSIFASSSSSDDSDGSEQWPQVDIPLETRQNGWDQEFSQIRMRATAAERICRIILPEIWAPSYLNGAQVSTVKRGLNALVPDFAFSGCTMFVHHDLYKEHQPEAYQDAVAMAALYVTRNDKNQSILANSIGRKISNLQSQSSTWSLKEHLAAVQAMIIYQIIRLFDSGPNVQAQAARNNALLELWSAHLWKRFFDERPTFTDNYESWVFDESLRRTILMSVFTRCGWSVSTKDGLADQIPVLARLPITRDLQAWSCEPEEWRIRTPQNTTQEEMLIAYGDMSATWTHERGVDELGPFGKLLLAACRGADDPRLLAQ